MPAHLPYCIYRPGESFLPEARRHAADKGGGLIELAQADLSTFEWVGEPIKILLVDAMKSNALTRQIARTFFPSLMAGGLLIHQDFKHFATSWIHILQYRLREHFRLQTSVPRSGTLSFEVLSTIPAEVVGRAVDWEGISDDEIEESFRHSFGLVAAHEQVNIAASHVMAYAWLGRKDVSRQLIETYRQRGLVEQGEFPLAIRFVGQ